MKKTIKIYVDMKTGKVYTNETREQKIKETVGYITDNFDFDPIDEGDDELECGMDYCKGFFDWLDDNYTASELFSYFREGGEQRYSIEDEYKKDVENTIRTFWELTENSIEVEI